MSLQILSDDWSKSVHLQADRTLEFHNQNGIFHKMRIPRFGRDLSYQASTCDLYVVGVGDEVFRLNLEQGQFMNPFKTLCPDINVFVLIFLIY